MVFKASYTKHSSVAEILEAFQIKCSFSYVLITTETLSFQDSFKDGWFKTVMSDIRLDRWPLYKKKAYEFCKCKMVGFVKFIQQ